MRFDYYDSRYFMEVALSTSLSDLKTQNLDVKYLHHHVNADPDRRCVPNAYHCYIIVVCFFRLSYMY